MTLNMQMLDYAYMNRSNGNKDLFHEAICTFLKNEF